MDPRISFSNDFVDTQQQHSSMIKYEGSSYKEAPVSSDFEFSANRYAMIPADEIFFKGVLMPLEENCTTQMRKMTLRDELLVGDGDDDEEEEEDHVMFPLTVRGTKSASGNWWKERLRLKRGHHSHNNNVGKKGTDIRNHGVLMKRVVEEKVPVFIHEEGLNSKRIREAFNAD